MRDTKRHVGKLLAFALALSMSAGLAGCGGGNGTTDTKSAPVATEATTEETATEQETATETEATEEATEQEATEEVEEEAEATETGEVQNGLQYNEAEYEEVAEMDAYMGVGDTGLTHCYAEDVQGSKAVMIVLDPETYEFLSFIGEVTNPLDTYVRIVDDETGNSLTFGITGSEGDAVLCDLGEEFGGAVLASCDVNEVLDAMDTIAEHGTPDRAQQ